MSEPWCERVADEIVAYYMLALVAGKAPREQMVRVVAGQVERAWRNAGKGGDMSGLTTQQITDKLRAENALLRGAVDSQDNRERAAGERCGVSYAESGCDWPDRVADVVASLRTENARLREALKPFAHQAVIIDDPRNAAEHGDEQNFGFELFRFKGSYTALCLGDCRRAREALG